MTKWEHVKLLKQGTMVWNTWREENPDAIPDFSYANLRSTKLRDANLRGANLSGADLWGADLSDTNLSDAYLSDAYLRNANLSGANLRGANLSGANLSGANLRDANLSGANLSGANLRDANLRDANLRDANLSSACFISYAHQDEALAQRLYKDLQDRGVRCWFALYDLQPGQYYRRSYHRGTEDAFYLHTKVLLLLSKAAVESPWVGFEVEMLLNREARERCELLFPLRLDDAVMQATTPWAKRLREDRHIGDFTNWQDDASYQQHFEELLRHLKVKPT